LNLNKRITFGVILFILMTVLCWILFWNWISPEQLTLFSQFYSGTIGVIVTLIFAIIAYRTFINQQETLKHQQLTFEHQQKTMQKQYFENTFFRFLDIRKDIISNMYASIFVEDESHFDEDGSPIEREISYKGQKVFEAFYEKMRDYFQMRKRIINIEDEPTVDGMKTKVIETLQEAYGKLIVGRNSDIGPYMRHMYHTLKHIDDQKFMNDKEKYFYVNMIRIQIPKHELIFLFYACISKRGENKFKPLVEKFGLLSHMPQVKKGLIGIDLYDYTTLIDESAFKQR
jgi:hypothetical protein